MWRESVSEPTFFGVSRGGWFKGRDPSVSAETLAANWVATAHILYIGKADAGQSGRRGLRKRLGEYLRFGAGAAIGHWGGRLIWHLADAAELKVYWKPVREPRLEETRLITAFVDRYHTLPFANLRN